jgi:hypothetical protein
MENEDAEVLLVRYTGADNRHAHVQRCRYGAMLKRYRYGGWRCRGGAELQIRRC